MFHLQARLTNSFALAMLCLLALYGCGGGGSTPSPILPVLPDLPHKDAYAITEVVNSDPCANPGPGQGCVEIVYPQMGNLINGIQINNQQTIVHDYDGPAAYWQNGQNITMGLIGGRYAVSRAVNDAGQIVGRSDTNKVSYSEGDVGNQYPNYTPQAFVWQNGTFTDLGGLPALPDGFSEAVAINNSGQIAGYASGATSFHAALWQNGTISDLDTGRTAGSAAYGINARGQVVGVNGFTAALWDNGSFTDLGALPNQHGSFANAINDTGQIVGASVVSLDDLYSGQNTRAVLWHNGQIQDLGTLGGPTGRALGINNAGQIVGVADTAQYTLQSTIGRGLPEDKRVSTPGRGLYRRKATGITKADPPGTRRSYIPHAFLWQNGVMTDLNTLVAAKTGWDLSFAASVNSKGQIVGFGTYKETSQIFLLTPR